MRQSGEMRHRTRLILLVSVTACASTQTSYTTPAADTPVPPIAWPAWVVSARPMVLYAPGTALAAAGRVAARVHFVPGARLDGQHVEVHVPGPLEMWGVATIEAAGVLVCEAGVLGDVPLYAKRGDLLALRSGVEAGRVSLRAEVQPNPYLGDSIVLGDPLVPTSVLCTDTVPADEEPGTSASLPADVETPVLAEPGGAPVHVLRGRKYGYAVRALEARADHTRILVGSGPYLVGWVPTATLGAVGGLLGLSSDDSPVPDALRTSPLAEVGPLHRIAAGTEVRDGTRKLALLHTDGYARVKSRDGDTAVVAAAVNDDGWIAGTVALSSIGAEVPEK